MLKLVCAALAGFLFATTAAVAQTCGGGLPYTLTNGTNADATQVMANFNYALGCPNFIETYSAPTITSGVLTINLSGATVFNVSNNANITTFTISNATAGKAQSFTLFLTANGTGYTQAWGSSVKWAGGTAPTITATSGKTDVLTFVTNNGGTTWYGFVGGQNF
jgi:hypothetical protein